MRCKVPPPATTLVWTGMQRKDISVAFMPPAWPHPYRAVEHKPHGNVLSVTTGMWGGGCFHVRNIALESKKQNARWLSHRQKSILMGGPFGGIPSTRRDTTLPVISSPQDGCLLEEPCSTSQVGSDWDNNKPTALGRQWGVPHNNFPSHTAHKHCW